MDELNLKAAQEIDSIQEFEFDTIKGRPMLRWTGKRPFSSTQFYPAQKKETYGLEQDGWMNKIFWGDNLQVMSHLLKKYRGQVDLIYIDPPFDSKADYKMSISLRGKTATNDTTPFEEKQYTDIWSNDEYLQFMYERLILMRELLSDSGSIYLHCDWHKSHLLRCIMDEVFGAENFRNEITWRRQIPRGRKAYAEYYAFGADYLLLYTKTANGTWNRQVSVNYITIEEAEQKYFKDEGGYFRTSDPGSYTYESLKELYNQGRLYAPHNGVVILDEENRRVTCSNGGKVGVKYYREQVGDKVKEETQKPEALLKRVIEASSNPGDLVFDCFMGSGTTQAVAMKLGRRFIGADINLGAIETSIKRLNKTAEEINDSSTLFSPQGKYYKGFEVYNVNNYDVFRNPAQAKDILIEALELQALPANSIYDGEKDGRMVKIMPINRIATKQDLNDLITGFPRDEFEKKQSATPGKAIEQITLVCMGHEPQLAADLVIEMKNEGFIIDVEVLDILRDRSDLEFKRDSEAVVVIEKGKLIIKEFYPMNLLQKLSLAKDSIEDWKELVDSVKIDFNFDGKVFTPTEIDVPEAGEQVKGIYSIPKDAGTIKIKITDCLSESLEKVVNNN